MAQSTGINSVRECKVGLRLENNRIPLERGNLELERNLRAERLVGMPLQLVAFFVETTLLIPVLQGLFLYMLQPHQLAWLSLL